MGWGKVGAAGLRLSRDPTSPRVALGYSDLKARRVRPRNRKEVTFQPGRGRLRGGFAALYGVPMTGKYCRSRLGLTSSSRASASVLLLVCLWTAPRPDPP